jgi:hypothetical protein
MPGRISKLCFLARELSSFVTRLALAFIAEFMYHISSYSKTDYASRRLTQAASTGVVVSRSQRGGAAA